MKKYLIHNKIFLVQDKTILYAPVTILKPSASVYLQVQEVKTK
jgi:hypothetical protein